MIMNCAKTAELLPSIDEITNKADNVCPVKWAVDAVELAMRNTCGKGTVCRDGLKQLHLIGKDITLNRGSMEDIELLQELCRNMYMAADCELSGKAIELFKTSMELHYSDWTAHILRKRCKAGQCEGFPKAPVMGAAAAPAAGGRRRRGGAAVVEETAAAEAAVQAETPAAEAGDAAPARRRRRNAGVVEVIE